MSGNGLSPELIRRAAEHGSRPALLAPEGDFTYGALLAASARVADVLLRGRADLAEARVAYLVPPGFRWTAVQWGIWRAGGIAVPLALGQPEPELKHVLEDSGAERVLASGDLDALARRAAELVGIPVWEVNSPSPGGEDIAIREAGSTAHEGATLPDVRPDRGAMILYTSGTTGRPKGVLSTHANLEAQVTALVEAWGWQTDDHVLLVLPLHHVHGIVNVLTCALWTGARCTVMPRFDAVGAWERFAEGDLTLFMAVPTVYQRLLAAWDDANDAVRARWTEAARGLRLCVSGSAALPVGILDRWEAVTGHRLLERYGMTEIGMALSNPLVGERRPGHVGTPLPRVEIRLVDERGDPVTPGGSGEIEVRGPAVFREYWGRPEETQAAFTGDGWFRTGDVARIDGDSFRILGRASVDIIKTGGEKVSALEVEEALREHPSVADCAVVGVPDTEWGERVCAAIVPAPGRTAPALDDLRGWARHRLAPWKIPRAVETVDALPRNAMGKVDKPLVRRRF